MIYKCPNCNGALEYDPATDKMQCAHCGNGYFVYELDENAVEHYENVPLQSEIDEAQKLDFTKEHTIYDEPEFIECKVYTCSTCGAELSVGDRTVSTYCAYCGQPTIVYNRVDKTQKPKYIIPFKITKEEAKEALRQKLKKGFFVPSKVKKIDVERICGIYLPYFIYDLSFSQKKLIAYDNSSDTVEAECDFGGVCQDASKLINDKMSSALEPFNLYELQDFEAGYLSGFYADRFDLSGRQLTNTVVRKCKNMLDDELKSKYKGEVVDFNDSPPQYAITRADYSFLPVYFMTFQYKDQTYTMMVNGQTGKVVGTVPFQKAKVVSLFLLLALIFSVPQIVLACWLYAKVYFSSILLVIFVFVYLMIGSCLIKPTKKKYKEFKETLEFTRDQAAEDFVTERQEDNL